MADFPARVKCQNHGCNMVAKFFVGSSAGWSGHHCYEHAGDVVRHQLRQVDKGQHGIVVLPYCEEASKSMVELVQKALTRG